MFFALSAFLIFCYKEGRGQSSWWGFALWVNKTKTLLLKWSTCWVLLLCEPTVILTRTKMCYTKLYAIIFYGKYKYVKKVFTIHLGLAIIMQKHFCHGGRLNKLGKIQILCKTWYFLFTTMCMHNGGQYLLETFCLFFPAPLQLYLFAFYFGITL